MHTTHISRSQSRNGSHLSHEEDTRALQLEIDHLKRKLRHKRQKRTPSISNSSIDDDRSYRHRSGSPPSESFSYDEDVHHKRKNKNSSSKGLGNDAMSRALNQNLQITIHTQNRGGETSSAIHLAHVHHIQWSNRPYGACEPFNQKMAVHSKNKALMCKVFCSILGPVAIRWFDGLGAGSIGSFKELTRAFGSHFITCSRPSSALRFLIVSVHERRGNLKKVFGQILGDVQ